MSTLKFSMFAGEVPRLTKRDLGDSQAQLAENLLADTPEFRPLRTDSAPVDLARIGAGQTARTIYRYPTDSTTVLGAATAYSLARSQITDDKFDRVYVSALLGEPEYRPAIMTTGDTDPATTTRRLGVPYPTKKPTLSLATAVEGLMTPSEVTDYRYSLIQTIKAIVLKGLEFEAWNPDFALGGMPGFRADPSGAPGLWQRFWTLTPPTTWNTHNGTPVANHLWTLELTNPPFQQSGGNRIYYATFAAQILLWRVKADVSAATAELEALVLPGTTDRVLTDDDIDALWAAMRSQVPDEPRDAKGIDLRTHLDQYLVEYRKLVNYLDQGFPNDDVSPQAAFQLIAQSFGELSAHVDAINAHYASIAGGGFDAALVQYFEAVRFGGKVPDGQIEVEEQRYYTYTFVNDRGEESQPYLPGSGNADTDLPFMSINQAQALNVTLPGDFLAGTDANDRITHWRLYRSNAGTQGATFQLVKEFPVATTTYLDLRSNLALRDVLRTIGADGLTPWAPPPVAGTPEAPQYLRGIVAMPGGFLAGFLGHTVYFSEPLYPFAWPVRYAIPCHDRIIGLGVFGLTLVVLTEGQPAFISGGAPDSMSKVDLESIEACVSPRSVVPVTGGVVFASKNGLCLANQSGVTNMTAGLFTREEWAALTPANMVCSELGGVIYFTAGSWTMALHVGTGKLVRVGTEWTALWADTARGVLYGARPPATGGVVAQVVQVQEGNAHRTARWRSKRLLLPREAGYAWLAVEGEQSPAHPLAIDLYGYERDSTGAEVQTKLVTATGDGTHSAVVSDTRPIRVSPGRFKDWEIEISGDCRVSSVILASSLGELQGAA